MKRDYYNYVGVFIFSYGALGFLNPLLGQYLSSVSFSGTQIGMITAAATMTGIFASPFWGKVHHKDQKSMGMNTMMILCFAAMLLVLLLMPVKIFPLFLIGYCLLSFFQTPVMPLCDAMALDSPYGFGAIRKWGAFGFGIAVLISGQLAEYIGLKIIFPLYSVSFFVTALLIIMIKRSRLRKNLSIDEIGEHEAHGTGLGNLLKNKRLMMLLLSAFFVCGTSIAHNTYFGFLYTEVGGSLAGIGLALLLMVASEIPFMAWTEKISERFTPEKMILIAMCISAARYIWYGTEPSHLFLLVTFFLQGMVNGIVLVEFVKYISRLVDQKAIGMAMTLYQSISSNCSTIICLFFGGMILDAYGAGTVYLFFGCYNIVGIIVYLICGLHKPFENKALIKS